MKTILADDPKSQANLLYSREEHILYFEDASYSSGNYKYFRMQEWRQASRLTPRRLREVVDYKLDLYEVWR